MSDIHTVLGIETSCDETSVAVVKDGIEVLTNVIASSAKLHEKTGGVVPEVAAREHVEFIVPCIEQALQEAGLDWDGIDGIAVTRGPGLIGSLLTGVNAARTLAWAYDKPIIGVNHIEGHMYGNWLRPAEASREGGLYPKGEESSAPIEFPVMVLTASGGHNELILIRDHGKYEFIGETLDDAAGEVFDKVARLLGLGYPGGPAIAKAALSGNPHAVRFPRAWLQEVPPQFDRPKKIINFNFSFSGLKSAVRRHMTTYPDASVPDIAASFQEAVVDVLASKLIAAADMHTVKEIHLSGGVSANTELRKRVAELKTHYTFRHPRHISYCTDNAAMIASAGYFRLQAGERSEWSHMKTDPSLSLS